MGTAFHTGSSPLIPSTELVHLLDSVSDGFVALDQSWNFVYLNRTARELLANGRDLAGKNVWDEFPLEATQAQFKAQYAKVMEQRVQVMFQEYSPTLNRWYDVRAYPAESGGITIFFRDITDRRETEQRLAMLAAVVEKSADFIGISTPEMKPFFVNEAGRKMVGLESDEDIQKTHVLEYFAPEDRPLIEQTAIPALLRDGRWSGEVRFRNFKTGEYIHTMWNVFVIRDKNGEPIAWATISPNLNELKKAHRAEEARREIEDRFRIAISAANLGTFDWDMRENTISCSPRMKEIYGFQPTDTPTVDQLIAAVHPDDRAARAEAVRQAVQNHSEYENEYRVCRPSGDIHWVLIRGRANYDDAGNAVRFGGVAADVTQRKVLEKALIRSEKLASVGRLAATIAHEVNNPLAAVTNLIYLVSLDKDLPANARTYLDTAQRELERAAHITKQTLGFYRETGHPRHLDVTKLIDDVLELYRPRLWNQGITVTRKYPAQAGVYVIEGELRQVISNIVSNAMDALQDQSGKITIHIKQMNSFAAEASVRISIADNGIGINPQMLSAIFEPFFTTKITVGTGLGLWVTREIIERNRGRIRVRSRVGKGSVFSITLPVGQVSLA